MSERILSGREKAVREAQASLARWEIKITELQVHPSTFYLLVEEQPAFAINYTQQNSNVSTYCGIPIKQAV